MTLQQYRNVCIIIIIIIITAWEMYEQQIITSVVA